LPPRSTKTIADHFPGTGGSDIAENTTERSVVRFEAAL
jgi:hypothetical protein